MEKTRFWKQALALLAILTLLLLAGTAANAEQLAYPEEFRVERTHILGEALSFTIPPVEHCDTYRVTIVDIDAGWTQTYSQEYTEAGTYSIPAEEFSSTGIYNLRFTFEGEGYDGIVSNKFVTVLEAEPQALTLITSRTNVGVGMRDLAVTAVAPDAETIWICMGDEKLQSQGDSVTWTLAFNEPQDVEIYALAAYAGEDEPVRSESVTIHVTERDASLNAMHAGIPAYLTAGQPLELRLNPADVDSNGDSFVDGNVYYSVSVYDMTDDWRPVLDESYQKALDPGDPACTKLIGDGVTVTVPGDAFVAGHMYQVQTTAVASGYQNSYEFCKLPALDPAAMQGVTLSVNGSDGSPVDMPSRTGFPVHVTAPGASCVRYWNGDEFQYSEYGEHEGEFDFEGNLWEDCQSSVYAQAYYGEYGEETDPAELDWEGNYSNVIVINVSSEGTAPKPVYEGISENPRRGETLGIYFSDPEPFSGLYAELMNKNFEMVFSDWTPGDGILFVPTIGLEPGWYTLNLGAETPGMANHTDSIVIHVGEPVYESETGVYLYATKTEAQTNESVYCYGYAPDNARLRFFDGRNWWDEEYNGQFAFGMSFEEAGKYDIFARAYSEDENGEPVELDSNTIRISVTSEGPSPITLSAPTLLQQGEDLVVSVTDLALSSGAWWSLDLSDRGSWDSIWHANAGENEPAESFTVPGGLLEAGHTYELSLYAEPIGYDRFNDWLRIYVADGRDEDITLTVNGETERLEGLPVMEPLTLEITAPGAHAISWFDGEDWRYDTDFDEENGIGHAEHEVSDAACVLLARACYDEINWDEGVDWETLNWSPVSNGVTVIPTVYGYADVPEIEAPDTVERGKLLPVTLISAGNANRAHIYLRNENGDEIDGGTSEEFGELPETMYLNTGFLEAGQTYYIAADVMGYGYRWQGVDFSNHAFTVTAPAEDADVFLDVSAEEVLVGERFIIAGSAENANRIELTVNEEFFDMWDGDRFRWHGDFRDEGEYQFVAVAHYTDENGDEYTRESAPVTLRVTSLGALAAPEAEIPLVAEAETDYVFTVNGLSEALVNGGENYWDIRLFDREEERDVYSFDKDGSQEGAFTVPAGVLQADHRYALTVSKNAFGYKGWEDSWNIYCRGALNENVHLTVNGSDGPVDALVGDTVLMRVSAPGAQAVMEYNGSDWYMRGDEPADGEFVWKEQVEAWNCQYIVKVCYDEIDWDWINEDWDAHARELNWSDASNAVAMNITNEGPLPYEIEYTMPESVERGQFLHVTVQTPSTDDAPAPNRFNARITDPENRGEYFSRSDTDGLLAVETADLEPGVYGMSLTVSAPGYEWTDAEFRTFEVTEPQSEIVFDVSVEDVQTYENLRVSAYAPGASRMRFFEGTGMWDDEWYGDRITLDYCYDRAGTYEIYAIAVYEDEQGNETEQTSETAVITVSGGVDSGIHVEGERQIQPGEDYVFSVPNLEQAANTWWYMDLCDREGGDPLWRINGDTSIIQDSYTIPAALLEADHAYRIRLEANPFGGARVDEEFTFYVTSDIDDNITLAVNGETESLSAPNNSDVTMSVHAPGAKAILEFDGYGWAVIGAPDENGNIEWNRSVDGERIFLVKACYEEVDWDWLDEDREARWSQMIWGGISNIVEVSCWSSGPVPGPIDFEADETVERGRQLHIRLTEGAEVTGYHARFCDESGENEFDNRGDSIDSVPYELTYETWHMEPGVYTVHMDVRGVGYEWTDAGTRTFEVTEPQSDIVIDASATSVRTNENIRVTAYAPGATRLKFFDGVNLWEDEWNSDNFTADFSHGEAGEYGVYVIAYYDDGEGHEPELTSETITIDVSSEGDSGIHIEAEPLGLAGEDYIFSVPNLELAAKSWWRMELHERESGMRVWELGSDSASVEASYAIPAALLETDHAYTLRLEANPMGYDRHDEEFTFHVVEETDDRVVIDVNGEMESVTLPRYSQMDVTMTAPGAKAFLLSCNGSWQFYGGPDTDGSVTATFAAADDTAFIAKACFDEIDWDWLYENLDENLEQLNWSGVSNSVAVKVESMGPVPGPIGFEVDETVEYSKHLHVRLTEGAKVDRFRVEFYKENSEDAIDSIEESDISLPYEFTISTWTMMPGVYTARLEVAGEGYDWTDAGTRTFEVTEQQSEIVIDAERTELLTNEATRISVNAPGTTRMVFFDGVETTEYNWGGSFTYFEFSQNKAGEYEVYVTAYFQDENGNEYERKSEVITIRVTSNGEADLWIEGDTLATADEDYTFSIPKLADYQIAGWRCAIWDDEDQEVYVWDYSWYDSIEFTMPAAALRSGHSYHIYFDADLYGYDHTFRELVFYCGETDGNVTLRINGETSSLSGVMLNDSLQLEITAPGATAIQWSNGSAWEFAGLTDGRDTVTVELEADSAEQSFFARACYDEIDPNDFDPAALNWSGVSNRVTVTATVLGHTGTPVLDVPTEVERGKLLPVTITAAEHADIAFIVLADEGGNWIAGDDVEFDALPQTVYLETINAEPGQTYQVYVEAWARGYRRAGSPQLEYPVAVIEPSAAVTIDASKTEALANENVRFVVSAPGAVELALAFTKIGDEEPEYQQTWQDSETATCDFRFDAGGCYEAVATATFEDENGNRRIVQSEVIEIVITSQGEAPITLSGEGTAAVGSDYVVTVNGLELIGDTYWQLRLLDLVGGEEQLVLGYSTDEQELGEQITFAADQLEVGHTYRVEIDVAPIGYDAGVVTHEFTVTNGEPQGAVTLKAALYEGDTVEIPLGELLLVEISAPGATAVSLYNGSEWVLLDTFDPETGKAATRLPELGEGTYELRARACYDEITEPVIMDELNWTEESDPLTITVIKYGTVGEITFTAPSELKAGDPLIVTITEADHAEEFIVNIFNSDGGLQMGASYMNDGLPLTITMETGDTLTAGETYYVQVTGLAAGYDPNETGKNDHPLLVTRAGEPVEPTGPIPEMDGSGAFLAGSEIRFTFDPVVDAEVYLAEVRMVGDDVTIVHTEALTAAGSQALSGTLSEGLYEIRITAQTPGAASAVGDWVRFAVYDPLDVLRIPNGVTTIDEEAFVGAGAKVIIVPDSVTSIGDRAFADCPNLFLISLPEHLESIGDDLLAGCGDCLTVNGIE